MKNKTNTGQNKRSQAALEFMMSYGWAILVVLISIGVLTAFGILDPSLYFIGNKCKIHGSFYCEDFKIDGSNELVVIVVRNTLGFEARDVTISINSETCTEVGAEAAAQASGDVDISGSDNTINGGLL
jgi:hypothetical protein